ncbi:hypothetical protein DH2020_043525 [Rehmannia glutinosa]|uniref:RRM domain-containing protein n=1 Tax=Rehmannia glutinosa TaxID=99300 RepID=A0ABR0UKA7_REHGL
MSNRIAMVKTNADVRRIASRFLIILQMRVSGRQFLEMLAVAGLAVLGLAADREAIGWLTVVSRESAEMALSRLLQPKSSFQICRIGFSAARTRCCFSLLSNGGSDDSPEFKEEAGVEETGSTAVEPIVKELSYLKPADLELKCLFSTAAYVGLNKAKSLTDLFREHKDDETETTVVNEGTQSWETLSDVLVSFAKRRNTDSECLSHSNDILPSGAASDSQDDHLKEFPPNKCENNLLEYLSASYEGGERSPASNRNHKVLDLQDWYMKSASDQASAEIDKPMCLTFTDEPFEHSNEPHKKGAEKNPDIKDLIDFIRVQKSVPTNSTNSCNDTRLVEENSLSAILQTSDNNDRLTALDFPAGTSRIEGEETSNSDFKSIGFTDSKASSKVSFRMNNKDQRQLKVTHFPRKGSEENKVVVKFLRSSVPENHILQHFRSCGEILEIEFPNAKEHLFKTAYIYFKTREGFDKALKKSGSILNNSVMTVESATSTENVKIPIPSLIGDHDIPAALVKNPTRTIKIEHLTLEISSCHIEEALAFCESNISGYFLGSSHSIAYVEFETEIGKERALAKQSINVLGRHLLLLRIDSPRTTVVRISNIHSLELSNIHSICRSLGGVRLTNLRNLDTLDVHFGPAEWPNMLKILNRLNGFEVEGRRLQAEPAPVFPPDVLYALWHQPEERKRLKATAQALLHKIRENTLDTCELASLQHVFEDYI